MGIRHYDGVAHPGEFVHLVREPNNPFDSNAVRVENLHGRRVGHIKRQSAVVLAAIMDRKHDNIKIEATVKSVGSQWEVPATIEFYGVSTDPTRKDTLMDKLLCDIRDIFLAKLRDHHVAWFHQRSTGALPAAVEQKMVKWSAEQEELDAMFEKLTREQLSNLPQIAMPTQFQDGTELFEYQKQGIRWLVHQETGNKPPPFYKQVSEGNRKMWLCEITQCSQPEKPLPITGSILADEMGLGRSSTPSCF